MGCSLGWEGYTTACLTSRGIKDSPTQGDWELLQNGHPMAWWTMAKYGQCSGLCWSGPWFRFKQFKRDKWQNSNGCAERSDYNLVLFLMVILGCWTNFSTSLDLHVFVYETMIRKPIHRGAEWSNETMSVKLLRMVPIVDIMNSTPTSILCSAFLPFFFSILTAFFFPQIHQNLKHHNEAQLKRQPCEEVDSM